MLDQLSEWRQVRWWRSGLAGGGRSGKPLLPITPKLLPLSTVGFGLFDWMGLDSSDIPIP